MRAKLMFVLVGVVFLCAGLVQGKGIVLDSINTDAVISFNHSGDTLIAIGQPVTFYLRVNNDAGIAMSGITNGFRVYSTAATWTGLTGDTVGIGKTQFDGGFFITGSSNDGAGADTLGFGGFLIFGAGLPDGFNELAYTITTGNMTGSIGDEVCIDSSFFPPSNSWTWSDINNQDAGTVDWSGPHCFVLDDGTDVNEVPGNGLPTSFALMQNYPNPFNPDTKIDFDVARRGRVTLEVYNVLGQKVATLVDRVMDRGSYQADWDGTADNGSAVSTGIYFYKLEADSFRDTKKMMLLK